MPCICMCTALITKSACHTSMKCAGYKWSRVLGPKVLECKENVKTSVRIGTKLARLLLCARNTKVITVYCWCTEGHYPSFKSKSVYASCTML